MTMHARDCNWFCKAFLRETFNAWAHREAVLDCDSQHLTQAAGVSIAGIS
jgi:hypothetical protein